MEKITQFNKSQLSTLRRELNSELEQLGARLGLTIKSGNISYETNSCTIQVKAQIKGSLTRNQQSISMHASLLGLSDIKYGSVLHSQQRGALKLVDYKPRSPKYPWVAELTNGSRIKMTDAGLKHAVIATTGEL
jgi:hypothetical protein